MLQPADVRCWTEKSYINIYATPMRNKLAMLITIIISIIIIVIMGGGGSCIWRTSCQTACFKQGKLLLALVFSSVGTLEHHELCA